MIFVLIIQLDALLFQTKETFSSYQAYNFASEATLLQGLSYNQYKNYKMHRLLFILFAISAIAISCVQDDFLDDFVEPELRISGPSQDLEVAETFQYTYRYFNNVGARVEVPVTWTSNNPSIISIDENGLATAVAEGTATISGSVSVDGLDSSDAQQISVQQAPPPPPPGGDGSGGDGSGGDGSGGDGSGGDGSGGDGSGGDGSGGDGSGGDGGSGEPDLRSIEGEIMTTTFYTLEGDFTLSEREEGGLLLDIADNYRASTGLPGFYVYLSNNRNSIANAFEISKVNQFTGAHSYEIEDVELEDYRFIVYWCAPFNVKIGDAELNL